MDFKFSKMLEEVLTWIVAHLDGPLWDATIVILLGTGLFFTITTRFVQFRLFPASLRGKCGFGRAVEEFINTFPSVYDRSCEPRWCR